MAEFNNKKQKLQKIHRTAYTMLLTLVVVVHTASAKTLINDDGEGIIVGTNQHSWHHINQNSHHLYRHLQRRNTDSKNSAANIDSSIGGGQCKSVRDYFETIDTSLNGIYTEKGTICNGNCCSSAAETLLLKKAKNDFERLLHHHTESIRGILESTASLFQNHVLELAQQSENKTLGVFSQVYRRMVPLSRKLIHELYSEIMSYLRLPNSSSTSKSNNNAMQYMKNLEEALHKFFVNLFPVAYHQAVHLSKESYGELHEDYINCLKHTFDELQPFGTIPNDIKRNLLQSIQTAVIFINTLKQSSEVLGETHDLYATYLTENCQKHLLKMSYCPSCNGMEKSLVKTCYSYCMNVLRGCSAQYAGVLDSPWSNVVDAIDNLVTAHIRSDNGIVTTIKLLDTKLSAAIMRAMENGPQLEKKVKKSCGAPKLLPSISVEEIRPMGQHAIKWATPPDTEILRFLSTIDKSREFFASIVNNVCQDEDIQRNDHNCWTGDRISDYTQLVMTTGVDTQKYNPEVPFEMSSQSTKLNELVDRLIKIRKSIWTTIPAASRAYSDIQSDMARHDEEGSGHLIEDNDDEEYGNEVGSGDGSGDDDTSTSSLPDTPKTTLDNSIESRGSTGSYATKLTMSSTAIIMCLISTAASH